MLERTAACLESGTLRRLLPSSGKSLKSRRSLHSAFWAHGATELELSPLWDALLRGPEHNPADQSPAEQKVLSGSGGVLLDFLYPAGTIHFLQQFSAWGFDRPDGRRGRVGLGRIGHRLYTSSAKDTSDEGREKDIIDVSPEVANVDLEALSLLKLMAQEGAKDYDVVWYRYKLLDHSSQREIGRKLIVFLASSKAILDAERLIELFEKTRIVKNDSDIIKPAIRAYLRVRRVHKALHWHEKSLREYKSLAASDALLAYLIENSDWSRAFQTWKLIQDYGSQLPGAQNLFDMVMRLPKLDYHAIGLVKSINNKLRRTRKESRDTNLDPPNASPSGLVSFTATIVRLAMFHANFYASKFEYLLNFLRKEQAIDAKFYDTAVGFLQARGKTELAVKIYRMAREEDCVALSQQVLHEMLKIFCDHKSILGMQQVLDDFFRCHTAPTPGAYRRCMKAFASMGDAETVHALFKQYLDRVKGSSLLRVGDMSPILSVHAKRGELAQVVKYFDEIQAKYGLHPDLLCWNILMHAYCKVNDVVGAYACWEKILDPSNGLTPDAHTFGTIMGLCVRIGDLERTVEVYRCAESLKIQKSNALVDMLVLAHVQDDRYQEAEQICEEALAMDLRGSRTRMWNYLLMFHATHRDLVNINRVLQRMSDANIEYDGMTYGALMQILAMVGQPNRSYAILKKVMKEAGVKVTNFHYAIVMGGYLATKEYNRVFDVYNHMRLEEVKLSASNNLLIMKATFREDELLLGNKALDVQRRRAMKMFGELVTSLDPQDSIGPLKSDGRSPAADVVGPAMLNSFVLFILAQHQEHATVMEVYGQYLSMLPENKRGDPSISMLSALAISNLRNGDHESVKACFDMAMSSVKTHGSPIAQIPPKIKELDGVKKVATPAYKILPVYQLDLSRILTSYMNSLDQQGRADDLIKIINDLLDQGFHLTNKNWNHYISILSKAFQVKLAFTLCEKQLMPGWTGWARIRWQLPERNRLPFEVRAWKKEPRSYRPLLHTLLYLSRNFLELEGMSAESKAYQMLLSDLDRDCPRTMQAIKTMQRVDDQLERKILGGY